MMEGKKAAGKLAQKLYHGVKEMNKWEKGEKNMGKISQRDVRRGCGLWDVPGSSNKEMDYCRGTLERHGPQTPSGFASCGRLISLVVDMCFHCFISLYLGSKLKSKQCSSCF